MKLVIVFLLVCVSLSDGRNLLDDRTEVIAPPPTALVGINVTWTFNAQTNTTNVTMIVKRLAAGEWAAVGFGQYIAMDGTHVFMCKLLANNTVVINRYANTGKVTEHKPPIPAGSEYGGVFTPLPSQFVDGIVTCQFTLSNCTSSTSPQPNTLDPLSQSRSYHPIFAVGMLDTDNSPQKHNDFSRDARIPTAKLNQPETILYKM